MELTGQKVRLRDLTTSDLDDYRRWFSAAAEWQNWDAPWEKSPENDQSFIDRLSERLRNGHPEIRSRFEIWHEDHHIGWVSAYLIERNTELLAVGIDLPESEYWGKGLGREALRLWIKYLFQTRKPKYIYCETWGGNARMIKLALNLGFEIIERYTKIETDGKEYDKLKFRIGGNLYS